VDERVAERARAAAQAMGTVLTALAVRVATEARR
jgi:hypothetical protein